MTWYKWEPGLIPYLERSHDLVRGILHRCADDYWRGYKPDLVGNAEAELIWPVLKAYLDDQKTEFEEKHNSRHIKAEHAASMRWASPSITRDAQGMLGMPEKKRKEEKRKEDKKPRLKDSPQGQGVGILTPKEKEFLQRLWETYPARKSENGQPTAKGNKLAAIPMIRRAMATENLTEDDVIGIVEVYLTHPTLKEGYVQSVERFFGPTGRWYECWGALQNDRTS